MRIIICDDDQSLIDEYKEGIGRIAAKNGIDVRVEGLISGERLLFELSDDPNDVDLIYMDINFQEKMDGIIATKQLRDIGYKNEIVFLTKDKSRVFEAFDVEPLHYIVKDVTDAKKFEEILMTAAERVDAKNSEVIALSCAGDNRNIPIKSILYFEVVRRVIEVHYDDEVFEFYSTIGKLENLLFDKGFIRVHRAYLVSMDHIKSVKSTELVLDSGESIPVGRTHAKELKERMNENNAV
ncbi:MAG: LytTR family DNA-binding domain-containing protein [Eubacteriaceae bacterium]|nr:LytTR family DNA-binding domain-containing protein [Eubacteriaceae bacterium]